MGSISFHFLSLLLPIKHPSVTRLHFLYSDTRKLSFSAIQLNGLHLPGHTAHTGSVNMTHFYEYHLNKLLPKLYSSHTNLG